MQTSSLQSARTSLSVLVVDDDPILGELLGMKIAALGCHVQVVETARDAIVRLAAETIHLLVTDWQMPEMDGMQLVAAVRKARASDNHLHIAMMTARGEDAVIRAAMEAGVDDFLYKPIVDVELELVIESAARNRLLHHRLMRRNELLVSAHRRTRDALDRVHADLEAATTLHERLLPRFDRVGVLELSHLYRPAALLGGDSIGVSPMRGEGLLFFLIDVCGHGVPAALNSFHLHHRIKQLRPTSAEELGAALATINGEICERADDTYATVACGLIFPQDGEGWLICAGHPPPLLCVDGKTSALTGGRAMPIGWFEDVQYEAVRFPFPRGARLVIYSDGVTDVTGVDGAEFGIDRLEAIVAEGGKRPLRELAGLVEEEVSRFGNKRGLDDDLSLLTIGHDAMEATG